MGRARKRADRIRERVNIVDFLSDLGYAIHSHGGHREQQFSCDLHGDGTDSKPSARVYPSSNSWYCFACSKKRDSITTLMEKKGLTFHEACDTIENKYGLPPLPFEKYDDGYSDLTFKEEKITFESMSNRIKNLLKTQRIEKSLSLPQFLSVWEVYNMILYKKEKGKIKEEQSIQGLMKIRNKIFQYIRENNV